MNSRQKLIAIVMSYTIGWGGVRMGVHRACASRVNQKKAVKIQLLLHLRKEGKKEKEDGKTEGASPAGREAE